MKKIYIQPEALFENIEYETLMHTPSNWNQNSGSDNGGSSVIIDGEDPPIISDEDDEVWE